ncbi:MAG TPA: PQQ-binding-like beta-propeller repeat protein [Actinomycetota bacterium]|nr:PQQ-binding-like beta-propeller repeat protein [Actinomycetota bacterium]
MDVGATRTRRGLTLVIAAIAVAMSSSPLPSSAEAPCTGGGDAGSWPMYGRDLWSTRNQVDERSIGRAEAGSLRPAWIAGVQGGVSTAVVAGNCVYVADDLSGTVSVLHLDTGALVWQRKPIAPSYATKTQTAALSVVGGVVYANASEGDGSKEPDAAPVGVAYDADTGELIYESEPVQFGKPTTAWSSAVVANGVQLVVTNGGDGIPDARPGYAILDATTGETLHKQTTIPLRDIERGYAGGGQWSTPVVDVAEGYAYNGTANPYSKKLEHRYDNALIKIDIDPSRPTFGKIVDAYKGNVDQFIPGLDRQPLCDMFGEDFGYHPCCNFSVTCVQLDIDFGASPTMWRNEVGELMLGALQKSGVFHAVYAETMQSAWTATVGVLPTVTATAGNAGSPANDGDKIYVVGNPGVLHALDAETGRIQWVAVVGDGVEYHPVSVANGVVYVIGNHGMLMAFDARDGSPLLASSMPRDASRACFTFAGGVSIARGTVLANCDGTLIAYRLPVR